MTAIVGLNGAGKSTLIKAALGIVPRVSGEVTVFGRPLKDERHHIAYVQRASVDWDFPRRPRRGADGALPGDRLVSLRPAPAQGDGAGPLDRVGMADFADRQIGQLSGRQRVFLAWSPAQDAALYVMERLAGVDAATEQAIVAVLRNLKEQAKTVLCVHHDLDTVPDISAVC